MCLRFPQLTDGTLGREEEALRRKVFWRLLGPCFSALGKPYGAFAGQPCALRAHFFFKLLSLGDLSSEKGKG